MNTPIVEQYRARIRELVALLNESTTKLSRAEQTGTQAIAIIGVGCRFPAGGRDPESFWRALEAGVDGVRRIPTERWPPDAIAGHNLATRWAGLLDSLDGFDAPFFGISPREATRLDPQHRLLLEVTWEALEHAGQRIDRLFGSQTGVFVGMMSADYGQIVRDAGDYDMYSAIGNTHSTAAGRIAYTLGLHGPCLTIDTACSSSLVAAHLACQSLRQKESDLAIVAGVNVILDPAGMAMLIETQAISPDGRCKTFDAEANGFVRGEGCGIVVLKRLSDAERDGDPIVAVIRGSVVNQDGRSTGMTAPNVLSQQAMLRRALEIARLAPEDIGYVETHGTGTLLGDPIEFEALREVLGKPRADGSSCVLGALKTNVGHMEGAAGIGGLIKAILCLQHEAIPKNLHFKTLNPRMSLEGTPFVIPTETIPWKANGKPRRAGVSSFGISGTNAHVILEEAPRREEKPFSEASSYLLPLSAKTPDALSAMAKSYQEWFATTDAPLHHVTYTASLRRSHLEHRLGVVGSTKEEIAAALGAFAAGEMPPSIVTGKTTQSAPKVVFVFPGQGSQWVGMGRQLLREEPAFCDALAACDEAIRKEAGFSVIEELDKPEETSRLSDIDVVQPVLFAMEVALAALWRSWGVEPAAVVGHSMGEVAAAFVAGALSMADAAAIICRRSRLLRKLSGKGAMALVELTLPNAEKALVGYENRLSVAVSNGPRSTVIAGDPAALDEVLGKLEKESVFCQRIKADVASHSPQMDPLLDEVVAALSGISPKALRVAMRSTVTGEPLHGDEVVATYWAKNLRKPVQFSQVIEQLIKEGHTLFLELSPHPVLLPFVDENLQENNIDGSVIASLRYGRDERQSMLSSLGALFVRGVPVAWKAFFPDGGRVIELPTYPWQRERYWVESTGNPRVRRRAEHGATHPLLGDSFAVSTQPGVRVWENELLIDTLPYLREHRVQGKIVVPGAAFLEMAMAALPGRPQFPVVIEGAVMVKPLMPREDGSVPLQTVLTILQNGRYSVVISSVESLGIEDEQEPSWSSHAEMSVGVDMKGIRASTEPLEAIRTRCTREISREELYCTFEDAGVSFGPTFQCIQQLFVGDGEAFAHMMRPTNTDGTDYRIHPAFLDAVLQMLGAACGLTADGRTRLLASIGRLVLFAPAVEAGWCHARVRSSEKTLDGEVIGDVLLFDDAGNTLMLAEAVRMRQLVESSQSQKRENTLPLLGFEWERAGDLPEVIAGAVRERWLVVGSTSSMLTNRVESNLLSLGHEVLRLDVDGAVGEESGATAIFTDKLHDTLGKTAPFHGAVHLVGADDDGTADPSLSSLVHAQAHAYTSALVLSRALASTSSRDAARLFLITRGTTMAHPAQSRVCIAQAPLSGLARSLASATTKVICRYIDLDPTPSGVDGELLAREFFSTHDDDAIALRSEGRYCGRLKLEPFARPLDGSFVVRNDATYVIVGGPSEPCIFALEWLVARGAQHFVLCHSRNNGEMIPAEMQARLDVSGVEVRLVEMDWTVGDAALAVLSDEFARVRSLGGVYCAVGASREGEFFEQPPANLANALENAVSCLVQLHELTKDRPIDMFVVSIPIDSLIGTADTLTAAAAGAFASGLADQRRIMRLPALVTLHNASGESCETLEESTVRGSLLAQALGSDATFLGAPFFNGRQWVQQHPHLAALPRVSGLLRKPKRGSERKPNRNETLLRALTSASSEDRPALVERFVTTEVAHVLRMPTSRIDRMTPLRTLGIDSLMSLEFRNRLERLLDLDLPATLVFTYPTVATIAEYLLDQLGIAFFSKMSTVTPLPSIEIKPKEPKHDDDRIAIIGMACRFPGGAKDPNGFWNVLAHGVDTVTKIPLERWQIDADSLLTSDPLRQAARWGAFVTDDVSQFDASFFGISPREAVPLDPQQRMLLELTWEALEHAGIAPATLVGGDTGVFVGFTFNDYVELCNAAGVQEDAFYAVLGNGHSVAAGRISYTFGFQGPCMTVDTACSSSLVAVHLACRSLLEGESPIAIAAGSKLMLSSLVMEQLTKTQGMSPDGRCKTFDAGANGFVRGEGGGLVVLKRLSDAQRDGDPILAVIRGSVVNQDGRSAGMAAPNVLSQQSLLRKALKVAQLRPEDIGYVETHGTGTSLGDPIEFDALRDVLGAPREGGLQCVLGALKTNVGHMEASAGIGGIIKAVLCLQHEAIPKNLHFKTLNPRMSLEGTPFVIPTETIPWKSNGKPRRAGVSAFGVSGTNAHVILEEAPSREEKAFSEASSYLLPLSAKTPEALSAMAKSYQEWLSKNDEPLHHVTYTASLRRSHLEQRLSVVGSTKEEIAAALGAFAAGEMPPGIVTAKAGQSAPKVVFVFPGQGSQWIGMGRQLYREEPAFRDALLACDEAIRKEAGFSVVEELDKPEETSRLDETVVAQPALFATEVALSALLQSWGIVPAAVIGHSVGEIAAAHIAGILDLAEAARLVTTRARVMQKATGHGKMVSVVLSEEDAQSVIASLEDRVGIAAVNDFGSVVLSGDVEAIDLLVEKLAQGGVQTRPLRVNYAFHSPQMEPLLAEFKEALGDFTGKPASIPMISTVTGKSIEETTLDATYWAQNIRQTVRFAEAITSNAMNENCVFVEVGPHPVLAVSMEQTFVVKNIDSKVLPTLRRDKDERKNALMALGALHTLGVDVDWKRLYSEGGKVVELPTYPWQRKRYWIDAKSADAASTRTRDRSTTSHKTLLGRSFSVGALPNTRFWESEFRLDQPLPLSERKNQNTSTVSWSAQIEIVLEAARAAFGETCAVDDFSILDEPTIDAQTRLALQVALNQTNAPASFSLGSATGTHNDGVDAPWHEMSRGCVRKANTDESNHLGIEPLATIRARASEMPFEQMYARLARRGLAYGSGLRTVQQAWALPGEALGRLVVPAELRENPARVGFHWSLLEGCMQLVHIALSSNVPANQAFRMKEFHNASFLQSLPPQAWAYVRVRGANPDGSLRASFALLDDAEHVVMHIDNVRLEPVVSNVVPDDLDDPTTVRRIMRRIVQQVAALHDADMDADQKLLGVGVDSLMFIQILRHAEQAFGVTISTQTMQRFGMSIAISTLHGLSDFVMRVRRAASADPGHGVPGVDAPYREAEDATTPIAVVNMERETSVPESYRTLFGPNLPIETWMVSLSNGETIEVLCAGSGEPLVLLPPIMASIPIWVFQIIEFSRTRRVIVPNYPGYGRSTAPLLSLSPVALSRRVHALLDAFGVNTPVDIVGWSLGGLLLQEFALAWPHRLRSLSLVNTTSHLEEEDSIKNMESIFQRLAVDLETSPHGEDAAMAKHRTLAQMASQKEAGFERSLQYTTEILKFDASKRIHAIRVPTLVVQGLQDTLAVPRYGRLMAESIAGSTYHEFADGGHFVPLHHPAAFNALLHDFLSRQKS